MSKLPASHEIADVLGVSPQTLRRWERAGRCIAVQRTAGGQRRCDISKLHPNKFQIWPPSQRITLAYVRVTRHDQKEDLARQEKNVGTVLYFPPLAI
jgi:putative resolvase